MMILNHHLEKLIAELPKEHPRIKEMERQTKQLNKLLEQLTELNDFNDCSKPETVPTNIVSIISNVINRLSPSIGTKELTICTTAPDMVIIDGELKQLNHIFYTLINNAVNFTPVKKAIEINILEENEQWVIVIKDEGIGIRQEKLPKIFELHYEPNTYYPVGELFVKDEPGLGLGMALTKKYIERYNGHISVESKVGDGTTFTVTFPKSQHHPQTIAVIHSESLPNEPWLLGGKPVPNYTPELPLLLLVDDDPFLLDILVETIEETGAYNYITATDGNEAMEQAINFIPDLVVSDIEMPHCNGLEFCAQLKTDLRTNHIPLIFLTSKAAQEHVMEGLEQGASAYLTKPVLPEELLLHIKNKLQDRAALSNQPESTENNHSNPDQLFIEQANQIVNENILESAFSVEHLANLLLMSRTQLHRKLKAINGQSASQFIRIIKLNKAAQLLKERNGNITEVAYNSGFSSVQYFSKCFFDHFECRPSEYL